MLKIVYNVELLQTNGLMKIIKQSGTLLFCSCHGIAGFLVDELQI